MPQKVSFISYRPCLHELCRLCIVWYSVIAVRSPRTMCAAVNFNKLDTQRTKIRAGGGTHTKDYTQSQQEAVHPNQVCPAMGHADRLLYTRTIWRERYRASAARAREHFFFCTHSSSTDCIRLFLQYWSLYLIPGPPAKLATPCCHIYTKRPINMPSGKLFDRLLPCDPLRFYQMRCI